MIKILMCFVVLFLLAPLAYGEDCDTGYYNPYRYLLKDDCEDAPRNNLFNYDNECDDDTFVPLYDYDDTDCEE